MAKEETAYRISGDQLVESMSKREIVTCTISLDVGLGGGIPRGCTVVLFGPPKLGKTTVCLQYAANAQKQYKAKVFVFPIEGRLTNKVLGQIQNLSLDIDSFEVVMPPAIYDKKGEVVGNQKWPAEKWWDAIGETIQNNPGCVVVVDSIAQLSPEKEISEDMGYQDRGRRNQLEAQFCRRFGDMIVANRVICFLMTQIQANTSGYGAAIQPKIGNQLKHQADIILYGKSVEKWDATTTGRILGHDMKFVVLESAMGSPFTELQVPLRYGRGIDRIKDIYTNAINWDIIVKEGAWFSIPFAEITKADGKGKEKGKETKTVEKIVLSKDDKEKVVGTDAKGEKVTPFKFQGEANMYEWLSIHPKEVDELEKDVRQYIFGKPK